MKKKSVTCIKVIFFLCMITSTVYSQELNSADMSNYQVTVDKFVSLSEQINTSKDAANVFTDEIDQNPLKKFYKTYKNVQDVKWFKLDNKSFVVYFSLNGIKNIAFYTKNGQCESLRRSYFEDQLPHNIRHLVKSNYYDYNIYGIVEVTVGQTTAYF